MVQGSNVSHAVFCRPSVDSVSAPSAAVVPPLLLSPLPLLSSSPPCHTHYSLPLPPPPPLPRSLRLSMVLTQLGKIVCFIVLWVLLPEKLFYPGALSYLLYQHRYRVLSFLVERAQQQLPPATPQPTSPSLPVSHITPPLPASRESYQPRRSESPFVDYTQLDDAQLLADFCLATEKKGYREELEARATAYTERDEHHYLAIPLQIVLDRFPANRYP